MKSTNIALPGIISSMHLESDQTRHFSCEHRGSDRKAAGSCWQSSRPGDLDKNRHKVRHFSLVTPYQSGQLAVAEQTARARNLAASSRETGLWILAVPVTLLGTQLNPEKLRLRLTIALRVESKICVQRL